MIEQVNGVAVVANIDTIRENHILSSGDHRGAELLNMSIWITIKHLI